MQPASKVTAPEALPARLPKGTELDGYVVEGWVRDGGMAAIYRARRVSDGVRVALKLQLPSTTHVPEVCRRFDREAEAMRRVTGAHHVVELHHAGVLDDERRYFMMEWIEGENLEEWLDSLRNEDKRFPVADVCELGLHIARGLATMHERELVHRDLKPANVMVGRGEDDALLVKLVDFGIVGDLRAGSESAGDEDEAPEAVMGTSAYMAPEQRAGHPPTPAVDVFALGVMLYEALTGTCVPPDGWTPETLPTIESQRRNVVPELVALVRACMSSHVDRRPRAGSDVASRLAVILGQLQGKQTRLEPSEVPIRTGGTVVMPRSQIVALQEAAAVRTGETEVALTHAQVLTLSGPVQATTDASVTEPAAETSASELVEPVQRPASEVVEPVRPAASEEVEAPASASVVEPVQPPVSASVVAPVPKPSATVLVPVELPPRASVAPPVAKGNTMVVTPVPVAMLAAEYEDEDEDEDDDEDVLPRRRWPLVVAVLVPVIALGSWLATSGREDDAPQAPSVVVVQAPDVQDDTPTPGLDEPDSTPHEPTEGQSANQESSVDRGDSARSSASGSGDSDAPSRSRSKGPDKAACEKRRAEAIAAKHRRDWSGVLEITSQTACWSSSHKLDRKRLRVQAFAELGNFARCVKEAGNSQDPQIGQRVNLCNKKLERKEE